MLEIDGSFGEGGGQILRSSLALSLLTGRAFHLRNVRAGREKPGLQPQHLMSVRAAAAVGQARTAGAALKSTDLVFEPGEVRAGAYHFPIGTAGATGLVLQTVYLPLALRGGAASTVTLEGGTHNDHSPCYHFLDTTWRAYLARLGIRITMEMRRPGFYPRGGGRVDATVVPCPAVKAFTGLRGQHPDRVEGFSAAAGLPDDIAARQARRVMSRLKAAGVKADIPTDHWDGGPGTVVVLTTHADEIPTVFFGLGARGKRAERVADEAVDQLLDYRGREPAVDPHSADQLILPLAFAAGPSTFAVSEVTRHLLTNVEVVRLFVDREIVCRGAEGGEGTVSVG